MKKKCENPNGLQNMQTIADAKTRKSVGIIKLLI